MKLNSIHHPSNSFHLQEFISINLKSGKFIQTKKMIFSNKGKILCELLQQCYLLITFLLSSINLAQSSVEKLTASINGTIIKSDVNPSAMISSENGKYWCTYEVIAATDEIRELSNLKLYKNENLILNLNKIPGSDLSITNSGRLVFYDHSEHFNGKLKIQFYSKEGNFLFGKNFNDADHLNFHLQGK